jgi:hypothetical protein
LNLPYYPLANEVEIDYCINSSGLVEGTKGAVKSGMGNYLDFQIMNKNIL